MGQRTETPFSSNNLKFTTVTVKQSSKNIYHNNCKLSNVYAHRLATLLCPLDGNEIIYRLAMLLNVIEHGKKMQLLQAANAEIYMN